MKLVHPWLLAAAALAPVLLLLLHRWTERWAEKKLHRLISPRLREQLLRSVDFAQRWRRTVLGVLAIGALLAAVARPQFGLKQMEVERTSVDFLVALDLSRSMLAEDMEQKPRLEAAKAAVNHLLDLVGSDRAGLIAFAGDAFLAAPVTQDHEALRRNLAALTTESIAKQGSDLAKAIELASATFEHGKYETKALVIVTDGEELQGDAIVSARNAAQRGLKLFTVGVGSSIGARIPGKKEGGTTARFARNEFGNEVVTRLNERMLQQLAASGGGFYEPLGHGGAGLESVWRRGLAPLAKGTQTKESKDMEEYFQWPLGMAVALLLAEMLVSERRKLVKGARA